MLRQYAMYESPAPNVVMGARSLACAFISTALHQKRLSRGGGADTPCNWERRVWADILKGYLNPPPPYEWTTEAAIRKKGVKIHVIILYIKSYRIPPRVSAQADGTLPTNCLSYGFDPRLIPEPSKM